MVAPIFLTHNGKAHSISEWARIVGMYEATLRWRLDSGWDVARALETPVGSVVPKPPVPRHEPPRPTCDVDPEAWLLQVLADKRKNTSIVYLAACLYEAVKAGVWPLTLSDLARRTGSHRRTLQRMLPKLEYCGHVRTVTVHATRVDIILVDKSAPAEPALMAAQ